MHLNIDNSRIKNITARLLHRLILRILGKAVCKFQIIWVKNKKKTLWILVQKLSILKKRTLKIRNSATTHSLYSMERKKWGLQSWDPPPQSLVKVIVGFYKSEKIFEHGDTKLVVSESTESIAGKTSLETK